MGIARTCCLATNVRRVLLHLHSRHVILMRRGQLEVRLASGSASVRQSQLFWSAATCRRYGPGVSRKAATSRRTPYRTRHLSVFFARIPRQKRLPLLLIAPGITYHSSLVI